MTNDFIKTLKHALIYEDDDNKDLKRRGKPKLLTNDYKKGQKVLTTIQKQLQSCKEFVFSVAFITNSGIATLVQELNDLKLKNVKGTIITTNYLYFNEPSAFERLMKMDHIDVRIIDDQAFHVKGYIFKYDDYVTYIIGSSNLTQEAITSNIEWNIELVSMKTGSLSKQIQSEITKLIELSFPITQTWINEYRKKYNKKKISEHSQADRPKVLLPHKIQMDALAALNQQREIGIRRSLVISATGTGKTYLAAFDAKYLNVKKLLFIIHREQIAKAAMDSFANVFDNVSMGLYTGNAQDKNKDFLFATVQTLSKDEHLHQFRRNEFDYLILDEAHYLGTTSYKKVLSYFNPRFTLGLTATPERTDGFNIYELLDNNIAYEIRLKEALEENMLCPFHYYGIADLEVNGELIGDTTQFNHLISFERINHIVEKLKLYSYSGDRVKGLIFCSRNNEAESLSFELNQRGFNTLALSGSNTQQERTEAIDRLTGHHKHPLDYIITVDIFNEGVDIPEINQVVLIRPTQSAIIFVQQLGRGLRKSPNKEFVVVIDFIGNYRNNFYIPIALSDDRTFNKDNLVKFIREGNHTIPGSSTVHFDTIVSEKVLRSVKQTNFAVKSMLKKEYVNLKSKLNSLPTLSDFYHFGSVDPRVIIQYKPSYYDFLCDVDETYRISLDMTTIKILRMLSKEILNGKRSDELMLLNQLLNKELINYNDFLTTHKNHITNKTLDSALRVLTLDFFRNDQKERYGNHPLVIVDNQAISASPLLRQALSKEQTRKFIIDIIEIGLDIYNKEYQKSLDQNPFKLYRKYTRKDACRLLNWEKDVSSTIYGYTVKEDSTPIFVTYHKDENVSESIQYEDEILNSNVFSWMTRHGISTNSKEVKMIMKHKETNMRIDLFVKKDDFDKDEFFYLGEVIPNHYFDKEIVVDSTTNKTKPIVNIHFKFKHELQDDMYEYFKLTE
jgi:superfamily II DNA or RNA helicase/HKD family nuclease